ncbi:MAG: carboxypeptidase regulatory-like domain-containing protein, partial [Gemmatimonadetes bacterium]|nr:carboxypeptidase regulatory-like domain-containing protein [Gemmatimonadota bacterium]
CVGGVLLLLGATLPGSAQTVTGRVVDGTTGTPVRDVTVSLLAENDRAGLSVTTDSTGSFALPLPHADTVRIRFAALAYEPVTSAPLAVSERETLTLDVRLAVDALELPPVVVSARRSDRGRRGLRDFDRRYASGQRTGEGRFLTREDLSEIAFLSHAFQRIPGLRYRYGAEGMQLGSRLCPAAVYLNGLPLRSTPVDDVWPEDLEAVEIYRRESEIPPDLMRPGVCTVVALWTRVDSTSGGRFWVRMGLLGALAGGFVWYVATN